MFMLKACPRCTGDLYLDRDDEAGPELYCMEYGFWSYGDVEPKLEAAASQRKPALARVA